MNRADRRSAIVRAASELFAERGFRGVTTRELAHRVGVTEPVLYEHFKTKRELYSAIIEDTSRRDFDSGSQLLEKSAQTDEPKVFFSKLATMIADYQEQNPNYMRLILFSALEGHELATLCFERNASAVHKIVIAYIKQKIRQGVFRKTDPAIAARAFLGMTLHYVIFELHFGFKIINSSKKRAISEMVGIFLRGMNNQ